MHELKFRIHRPKYSALEFLTSDRFAELDWDANGEVTFSEFLFAFMQWVGIEDSEAEASAEEKARRSAAVTTK